MRTFLFYSRRRRRAISRIMIFLCPFSFLYLQGLRKCSLLDDYIRVRILVRMKGEMGESNLVKGFATVEIYDSCAEADVDLCMLLSGSPHPSQTSQLSIPYEQDCATNLSIARPFHHAHLLNQRSSQRTSQRPW